MIITQTPFRISFFGGGTDYPAWYRQHGGSVLAMAIDKYCYITCRPLPPFFDHRLRIVYSVIETCLTASEVKHPAVRETLRHLGIDRGIEIHHDGDLPARSGMGSSSSFTVGLLNALHALGGRLRSPQQLATEAICIEQDILQETVGSQDQVLAAYGGFNHVVFNQSGEIAVRPMILQPERRLELQQSLMLFYTGVRRTAAHVANTFVPNIDAKRRQLRLMGTMVDEAITILSGSQPLADFGLLLHEAWQAKKSLSDAVSLPVIDDLYSAALSAGALGGKLTGAGGGGFLLLFVPPEKRSHVREALGRQIHVPFAFETSGSRVVSYNPDVDYSLAAADNHARPIAPTKELFLQP